MFDSVTAYKMLTCNLELLILERVPLDSIRANYEGKKATHLSKRNWETHSTLSVPSKLVILLKLMVS